MYFNDLLPLFTVEGDDGNYASTVALDLVCLQASSSLYEHNYSGFLEELLYSKMQKFEKNKYLGHNSSRTFTVMGKLKWDF